MILNEVIRGGMWSYRISVLIRKDTNVLIIWEFRHCRKVMWGLVSLVVQMVKNLPDWTQVQSLGWEDPLEKGMTTHFSILCWRIPWTEEPGRLQTMGLQRVKHHWASTDMTAVSLHFIVRIYLERTIYKPERQP